MSIWLDFRVDDECEHQQDVYQGCPLCANDKLQAEIDEAHALLKEGMEISKPRVKQLEMAVWRQGVQNYFEKHNG